MIINLKLSLLLLLLIPNGCNIPGAAPAQRLKYGATGKTPETIALYEAWFGHPKHISVGYSSLDPKVILRQVRKAKDMGISAFVVDWYGSREPFIDHSYALIQTTASSNNFKVAMMYDETDIEDGATDLAISDFNAFHEKYLSPSSPGLPAYLTYQGRPVFFIFPKAGHTDWDKVRASVNKWTTPPLLIQENLPSSYSDAFDGFYAWVSPGEKGWAPDGSNWGEQYLSQFYQTMRSKHADKIIVGGAWASFDDAKASWGLNRHMSARCGQTFLDTTNLWRKFFPADDPPPFLMIETWNDHEEGTAIEDGIQNCIPGSKDQHPLPPNANASKSVQN